MASRPATLIGRSLVVAAALLLGCAGTTDHGAEPRSETTEPVSPFAGVSRDKLVRAAQNQTSGSVALVDDIPLPSGVQPETLGRITDPEQLERANTPTDEVLGSLRGQIAPAAPRESELGPDAMRLYIAGRRLTLDGDSAGAVERLRAASELAPDSAGVHRELGEAQLANGQTVAGVQSFQRAYSLGSRGPRVLIVLAADAERRGEDRRAAALFAASLDDLAPSGDPAIPFIVRAGLGESLLALGYERAGSEMLGLALDLPNAAQLRSTNYGAQLTELFRRQSDLWITIGDSACRRGAYDEALRAYDSAAQTAAVDAGAALGRQIYVYMRLGRPAGAALALLDAIRLGAMLVDDRQIGIIRTISAASPATRDQLAGALGDATRRLEGAAPPSVLSGLTRARAAAMPARDARELLRSFLVAHPGDGRALEALFATYDPDDASGIARAAIDLVGDIPSRAEPVTIAALGAVRTYADFAEVVERSSRRSAVLVQGYALHTLGLTQDGYAVLGELDAPRSVPELGALAMLGELAGDRDASAAHIQQLIAEGSGEAVVLAAQAQQRAQRPNEARSLLLGLLETDPEADSPELRLRLTELCASLALFDEAKRHALVAITLDPADESGYGGLIALYRRPGADSRGMTQIIRQLRASIPSSQLLRELGAQENLRRGLFDLAEEQLIALATERPRNENAYQMLSALWERAATQNDFDRLDRGERWLRDQQAEYPEAPLPAGGLARLLAVDLRPSEALDILDGTLARRASFSLGRLRETILRDRLGRIEEADRDAMTRLDRGPRTLDTAIERSVVLVRTGRTDEAASRIEWAYDGTRTVTPMQQNNLGNLVLLEIGAINEADSPDIAGAHRLVEAVVAYDVRLTQEAHSFRVRLLALQEDFEYDDALGAFELFAAQYPADVVAGYLMVSRELQQFGHGPEALRLIADAEAVHDLEDIRTRWLELTVLFGDESQVVAFAERMQELGVLVDLVVGAGLHNVDPEQLGPEEQRAELTYLLAFLAMRNGLPERAEFIQRVVLSIDPRHPWTNNDLGYTIADRGGDLDEAERLLVVAYEQLSDDASIVDSLGWLRYKQGKILDTTDAEGNVVEEGALSLLRRAAKMPKGMWNETILDHLGDAAWLAGEPDEAAKNWRQAAEALRRAIPRAPQTGRDPELIRAEMRRIQRKIEEAAGGGEPEVADTILPVQGTTGG